MYGAHPKPKCTVSVARAVSDVRLGFADFRLPIQILLWIGPINCNVGELHRFH